MPTSQPGSKYRRRRPRVHVQSRHGMRLSPNFFYQNTYALPIKNLATEFTTAASVRSASKKRRKKTSRKKSRR